MSLTSIHITGAEAGPELVRGTVGQELAFAFSAQVPVVFPENKKVASVVDKEDVEDRTDVPAEDKPLPAAVKAKIMNLVPLRGQRIRVTGWVDRVGSLHPEHPQEQGQGNDAISILLRDGTGYLPAVLGGDLAKATDATNLKDETCVELIGTLRAKGTVVPKDLARDGHELVVDSWRVLGNAPGADKAFANRVNKTSPSTLADQRHLTLRQPTPSALLRLRAHTLAAFRATYAAPAHAVLEVTPPALVSTQVEGPGAELFWLADYYGVRGGACLTLSAQMYLETCLAGLGDVFCVQESFRAERSHTRRHLSEFTHLEAEIAFIDFDGLMTHIETVICETLEKLLADPTSTALLAQLNPGFTPPSRPFKRLPYTDAIAWLNARGITHRPKADDDAAGAGAPYVLGDEIDEAAERALVDDHGAPMFLYRFPASVRPFYMKQVPRAPGEGTVWTESCDLLMPGVGEVVGGSMRIADMGELLAAYEQHGVDPAPYYWYTDQRGYGSCEHGGYGLGVERFMAWLANRYTVRECSLYPRFPGRVTP
ncbi:class II aaRS and biotin synthetase [Leucogyrophana mollusca]|uniref:Class II aaRS and biotin synthetase n=1 Tax=Leucogyrophana mollusca TaxID=85980 RepID=A0ACB8B9K6_9AGAM|nr:class II aaRS and biotin synthetase [Leucogyrophana mollusca]